MVDVDEHMECDFDIQWVKVDPSSIIIWRPLESAISLAKTFATLKPSPQLRIAASFSFHYIRDDSMRKNQCECVICNNSF
jgi:hypothetical protein